MSRRCSITGVGMVGAFGSGRGAALEALGGIRSEPSPTSTHAGEFSAYQASDKPLTQFFNRRMIRRMDHFTRLALLAANQALEESDVGVEERESMGIIVASGYGAANTTFKFLDSVLEDGDALASPMKFSNSLHNSAAASIALNLKIKGPNATLTEFEMSFTEAVQLAITWLMEERVDRVLLGAVDEISPVLVYCYQRIFGNKKPPVLYPLDFDQQSAVPGEGAAFFVLEKSAVDPGRIIGFLDDIILAPCDDLKIDLSVDTLIAGADGHTGTGKYYASLDLDLRCYSPLYGSMPTGQALDLAFALCDEAVLRAALLKFNCEGMGALLKISKKGVEA